MGGIQNSSLANQTGIVQNNLVIRAMIAGLKLSNSVGNNNHVKIVPYININDTISYDVFV